MENNTEPLEAPPITITGEQLSQISLRQQYYWAGRAHREAGRLELAIAAFQEYADVLDDADKVYPWMWIGDIQAGLGETPLAAESYLRALSFSESKLQQKELMGTLKKLLPPAPKGLKLEAHKRFTKPAEMEKAIHTLRGIIEGMLLDGTVNRMESKELEAWSNAHIHFVNKEPFQEILRLIALAMADGELTNEELKDVLHVCQQFDGREGSYYDITTSSLQHLQGLCHGILADGQINEAELSGLRAWLDAHRELRKYYPFDELETILEAIVDGGSFGDDESLMLKALFLQYADIREQSVRSMLVGEVGDTYNLKGFCAVSPEIAFEGKRFCFTGESKLATRSQLQGVITRLGGKPENNVVKGLDYLIVGDGGSSCWAFSCYGRKVEKAIELRRAGGPVVIVQERDFWRAAGAKS